MAIAFPLLQIAFECFLQLFPYIRTQRCSSYSFSEILHSNPLQLYVTADYHIKIRGQLKNEALSACPVTPSPVTTSPHNINMHHTMANVS